MGAAQRSSPTRSELSLSAFPCEPSRGAFHLSRPDGGPRRKPRPRRGFRGCRHYRSDWKPPEPVPLSNASCSSTILPEAPPLSGELRFFEGAGSRVALAHQRGILALLRARRPAQKVAIVCPSSSGCGAAETAFFDAGDPVASRAGCGSRRPSSARRSPRFSGSWLDGGRADLFGFLRSPYPVCPCARRLPRWTPARPRDKDPERARGGDDKLHGKPLPILDADPRPGAAGGREDTGRVDAGRVGSTRRRSASAHSSTCGRARLLSRLLDELEDSERLGSTLPRGDSRLARARDGSWLGRERAGTRPRPRPDARAHAPLESSSCSGWSRGASRAARRPRPSSTSSAQRSTCASALPASRGPTQVSRERYLFYTACTRAEPARLPRARSRDRRRLTARGRAVLGRVCSLWPVDDVERWTTRRRLSSLTWQLERAPTERERLRALASLAPSDPQTADAVARANGWERKLDRARAAFDRPTRLRHPLRARRAARKGHVRRHRARSVRRLLLDLVPRAGGEPENDRPPGRTRAYAARSRTRRCTNSSPACRRHSAPIGWSRSGSTMRSHSSTSAWTRRSSPASGSS